MRLGRVPRSTRAPFTGYGCLPYLEVPHCLCVESLLIGDWGSGHRHRSNIKPWECKWHESQCGEASWAKLGKSKKSGVRAPSADQASGMCSIPGDLAASWNSCGQSSQQSTGRVDAASSQASPTVSPGRRAGRPQSPMGQILDLS